MDIHVNEPLWKEWTIDSVLGSGAYGTVYKAHSIKDNDRECAIKHTSFPRDLAEYKNLANEFVNKTEQLISFIETTKEHLKADYNLLKKFEGARNIVQVYDFLEIKRTDFPGYDIFTRMELLNSINKIFYLGDNLEEEVIRLGIDICSALVDIHEHNIIHRDIKPSNILVSADGVYKLADFSVARNMDSVNMITVPVGTFSYMAPEIFMGFHSPDYTVDIYSLGLVLYRLLNENYMPFVDTNSHIDIEYGLSQRMQGLEIPAPKNASNNMAKIIIKACSYHPEDRWQSAREFRDALLEIQSKGKKNRKNGWSKKDNTKKDEKPIKDETSLSPWPNFTVLDIEPVTVQFPEEKTKEDQHRFWLETTIPMFSVEEDEAKEVPNTLYKYTSKKFLSSCIKHGIYASNLKNVNDPYEGNGIENPELYRIACLTNSPMQMLMWAYYGNHQECCIEYDVSSISKELLKYVYYRKDFQNHDDMTPKEILQSLYSKGYEWKHEKEYRAVFFRKKYDKNVWDDFGEDIFLKAPIKSVTFGLLADKDVKNYLAALKVLSKHKNIEVKKCKLKGNEYALTHDKQFDFDIELEKAEQALIQIQKEEEAKELQEKTRAFLDNYVK